MKYNAQPPMMPMPMAAGLPGQQAAPSIYGMGANNAIAQGARAAQANPNPLTTLKPSKPGLATPGGIQQAAQKAGSTALPDWLAMLSPCLLSQVKIAEMEMSSWSDGGSGGVKGGSTGKSVSTRKPQYGQSKKPVVKARHPSQQIAVGRSKSAMISGAMQPTPGLTANQPAPPGPAGTPPMTAPGMPVTPPPNGGAPVNQGMGQPTIDPTTGQPIPQGQPGQNPAQQQQAQQPPPGAIDPATGQPITSPMQDAPAPPLPSNPQMAPPRAPTPRDHYQNQVISSLGHDMRMADQPMNASEAQEDMKSEAMAMGSKTSCDFFDQLFLELGQKAAGVVKQGKYDFAGEDCPKCKASMEGDTYTGACNSCGHKWGTKKASLGAPLGAKPALKMKPPIKAMGNPSPGGIGSGKPSTPATPSAGAAPPPSLNSINTIEKSAAGIPFGAIGKGLSYLGGAAKGLASKTPAVGQAVKANVGQTLGGAFSGGFAGNDLGMGGESVEAGPFKLNMRGAAAGALAANPFARRLAMRNLGGTATVPMQAMRQAGVGSMAGSMIDQSAKDLGYDTEGRFGQAGAWGGLGLGAAARGARMMSPAAGNTLAKPLVNASKQMRDLGRGALEAPVDVAKGVIRKPIQWVSNGNFSGGSMFAPTDPAKMTAARSLGRLTGQVGLAGSAVGGGISTASGTWNNQVKPALNNIVQEQTQAAYDKIVPQAKQDVSTFYDTMLRPQVEQDTTEYLKNMGVMSPEGKLDASGLLRRTAGNLFGGQAGANGSPQPGPLQQTAGNLPGVQDGVEGLQQQPGMFSRAMGHTDGVFKALGMDPTRLSAAQKALMLGGAGVGAYGLMSRRPAVAGVGGVASLAALAPYIASGASPDQLNGHKALFEGLQRGPEDQQAQRTVPVSTQPPPNTPTARNEWQAQREQQLQQMRDVQEPTY